jgi:hypothetical protein
MHMPQLYYVAAHPGDIDFDEFKQLVYDGMLLEGAIQDYEDAFNAVDDSGNGSIGTGQPAQPNTCCLIWCLVSTVAAIAA